MPRYEITCYETCQLSKTFEAADPWEAKALAEADIEANGWEGWQEDTLGTNGVELATDLETQTTIWFEDLGNDNAQS